MLGVYTRPFLVILAVVGSSFVNAQEPREQKLRDKLQGKWSKTNHPFSFEIQNNVWTEFREDRPLMPTNSGIMEFPVGKEYAVVRARSGHRLWIWAAGKDVIAVETFKPDGALWEDGRVFYRAGTVDP